jgi:uncharacterized protein
VKRQKLLASIPILAFILVQAVAFMQARAMTHFTGPGARTGTPETLGPLGRARVLLTGVRVPRPENHMTPAGLGLAYETIRLPREAGIRLEAWFVPAGEGPVLLAFPGYATSKADILASAVLLHEMGYSILLVDFFGVGGSSGSGTSLGFDEARDVATALAYARERWPDRPLVLYGTSMGGAAVLRSIAYEGARPDGVILEATFDTLLHTTRNRFRAMGLPATPFAEMLLFWGGVQKGVDCFSMSPARDARHVTCPALVLQAGEDRRVRPAEAEALRRGFTAPCRFRVYPGVPHMLIAEARPVEWSRDVRSFLEALP